MYRLRIESCLLLGAALLAGCSDRNTPTAPVGRPLAATTAVDRPYTWSVECSGDLASQASWSWTTGGVTMTGTEMSVGCYPSSGSSTRPAAADGFSACVNGTCHSWVFDPASAFNAQLKGSFKIRDCWPSMGSRRGHCDWLTGTATLNVAS